MEVLIALMVLGVGFVAWDLIKPVLPHAYTSTACHHGFHERCRRVCKFCDETCGCYCHSLSREEGTVH